MKTRTTAWLGAAALLAGCAAGPDYRRPAVDMPPSWQPAAPWTKSAPNDSALRGNWWEVFHDEQLNQLVQQALAQNQNLRIAAAHLEQARAQITVSAAALAPQLDLAAAAARAKTSADRPLANYSVSNVSTVQNDYQLGLRVNYEADLAGRVRRDIENARASAEQAAADFENTRLLLIAELASDYFTLRELDAEIDVVQNGLALQRRALQFITVRHDLGVASGLDLAQQQALLDSSSTQAELLQNQRDQYQHALAALTGVPAPVFALPPAVIAADVPTLPLGVPSDILQRRPDVASAERAMAAANARIGVAQAAYFPSVALQPQIGWESTTLATLLNAPSLFWSLGVSATQTVFDGGRIGAGVRIAEAGYTAAVANYRQTVLTAMQEVENGITGLTSLDHASREATASVLSTQRVLDLANDRYAGGLATYFDVITAQQGLLTNQRQAVQIRGQQLLTAVYLVKALGGGWEMPLAAK